MRMAKAMEIEQADLLGSQKLCHAGPHPPRPLERVLLAPVLPMTPEQWGALSKGLGGDKETNGLQVSI